jgi:hypothetical protein
VLRAWKLPAELHTPTEAAQFVFELGFAEEPTEAYGAPIANMTWTIHPDSALTLDVQYTKRPTRMAESIYVAFAPIVRNKTLWRLDKLGLLINPFDVVANGSRSTHAVWSGVYNYDDAPERPVRGGRSVHIDPAIALSSLDAPIVMMHSVRSCLQFVPGCILCVCGAP